MLKPDALFLVASITKPIIVTAAMILLERGELLLSDAVAAFVPEFAKHDKEAVEIRHLMTHTSGLPDMLPNNEQLRREHKPLSAFVEAVCEADLLFPPGTQVSYQSMGTLMLAEVIQRITGMSIQEFVRREIFIPLGMVSTSLGALPALKDKIVPVRQSPELLTEDWTWNSSYWLSLGAPWGGMITSLADLACFCQMMLNRGELFGTRILSQSSIRAMTMNQLAFLPGVPEAERRCRPWGLGWRLNWGGMSNNFGDLLGPRTYGHWGSTGTVCWIDPDAEAFLILFTTLPQDPDGAYLARISNMIAAALL
jgi:CubicO group peptidase (beta-lactamase class C family)